MREYQDLTIWSERSFLAASLLEFTQVNTLLSTTALLVILLYSISSTLRTIYSFGVCFLVISVFLVQGDDSSDVKIQVRFPERLMFRGPGE